MLKQTLRLWQYKHFDSPRPILRVNPHTKANTSTRSVCFYMRINLRAQTKQVEVFALLLPEPAQVLPANYGGRILAVYSFLAINM